MKTKSRGSKDPDILASEKALRRAARRALDIGLQTGTSVFVLKEGKIVDLTKRKPARLRKKGIERISAARKPSRKKLKPKEA
jgi:hypothetical protein